MQKARHYFPGGNTPKGFFSYYHQILSRSGIGRLAVIKGGPGTGKSTFMKQVGKQLEEAGEEVNYLHCSSDPDSLDGLFLPKYNSAVTDGTAPHVTDPRYPGGVDILLNFCDCIREDGILPKAEVISRLNREISGCFQAGYCYLGAASRVKKLMNEKSAACYDMAEGNRFISDILKRLSGYGGKGTEKTMFLSAITPKGFQNYLDEVLGDRFVVLCQAETGDHTAPLMEQLRSACRLRQIGMEIFPCPMNPDVPEHIVFPDANLAVSVANEYHTLSSPDEVVFFSDFCKGEYNTASEQIRYRNLLASAIEQFHKAKSLHDELEEIYIPNVDFARIQKMQQTAIQFLTKSL